MKRIYIAGPMSGYPEFNFPAFFRAEDRLLSQGHIVFNPARRDNEHHGVDISQGNPCGDVELAADDHGFDLREALGADTAWICEQADELLMLPGWQNSKGARAEHALSHALGLPVRFEEHPPHEARKYLDKIGYLDRRNK